MTVDFALAGVMVASSMASAVAALLLVQFLAARRARNVVPIWEAEAEGEGDAVFLFEDDNLVDANDAGRALLKTGSVLPAGSSDWARLAACLAPRFPDLTARLATLAEEGRIELSSRPLQRMDGFDGSPPRDPLLGTTTDPVDETLSLVAEWRNGLARIAIRAGATDSAPILVDRLSLQTASAELSLMRALGDAAPGPAWQCDIAGAVVWANGPYLTLVAERAPEQGLTWPLPQLFPDARIGDPERHALSPAAESDADSRWFEVHGSPYRYGALYWAIPVDSTVTAERRLADFRRTLARSFADLPVGLAIFDSRRRLHVFNPALTDLTQLDVSFLSSRPSLEVFLDRLREQQMLPEPKDYSSWRRRLTDLESAAASGGYRETWSLPCGQTFRVSGHPHPDGAVAFLFEDITAEISLQRRFRDEIECSQAALDAMEEAVIVFASSGHTVLSNAAYAELWNIDPMRFVSDTGLPEALRHWQSATRGGPDWARLRATVGASAGRSGWRMRIECNDGRSLEMRVKGLPRGVTLVGFRVLDPAETAHAPDLTDAPIAGLASPAPESSDSAREERRAGQR